MDAITIPLELDADDLDRFRELHPGADINCLLVGLLGHHLATNGWLSPAKAVSARRWLATFAVKKAFAKGGD